MKSDARNLRVWLVIVSAVSLLMRLGLWLTYPLTQNNDSQTYIQLARNLLKYGGLSGYNATRSPGYPAFLALAGGWVYFSQLLLGFLTTLLFFYIGYRLSGHAWFGGGVALAHTLNIGQLFFEATLLTETLTTFCIALSFAALLLTTREDTWTAYLAVFFASLAAALAGMARPLFVFLPFLYAFYLFFAISRPSRKWISIVLVLVPALIIFGSWLGFVYTNYKILSFDTIGGYRWLNHTGAYFELVPDQYAGIRDVYIKYRDAKIAATGTQTNAVWDAMNDLMAVSGMNFYRLSRQLTAISMDLIRAHPGLYLKNVASGWIMFWWAAVYWSAGAIANQGLASILQMAISIERGLLVFANAVFVIGSLFILVWKKIRTLLKMDLFLWLVLASVWAASVLQTLLDHGDNPRYLVPMQTLVIVVFAHWLTQIISDWKIKTA